MPERTERDARLTLWHLRPCGYLLLAVSLWIASGAYGAPSVRRSDPVKSVDDAASDISRVRSVAGLTSSLDTNELNGRLAKVLNWMDRDFAHSKELQLLSAAPEGVNAAGTSNRRLRTLQNTYWLQDNALYGTGALLEYQPALGQKLSDSWRSKWEKFYPTLCPDTESDFVIGIVPAYERSGAPRDPRCRLQPPEAWSYLRMYQYPDPARDNFDSLPLPIIGTDYPADDDRQMHAVPIKDTAVRDLLKYGCLRQVALGNRAVAERMFNLALAQWDGTGFQESREDTSGTGERRYWTRDLAFTLMCANALDEGGQTTWGDRAKVAKSAIERRLWRNQSASGGIWTIYCDAVDSGDCSGSGIPSTAKLTNEIAPLVLLAYGANIWSHPREAPN